MQQELREALDRAAGEPVPGARPKRLNLRTVDTGHAEGFDRADFYGDDAR